MQFFIRAFVDESVKIAAATLKEKIDAHFSAQTKDWDKFKKQLNSPRFRDLVSKHPQADEKLKLFVQNLGKHYSAKGEPQEVLRSTGKKHVVKTYKDGTYTCDCEHYMYRGAPTNTSCKHIDQIKSMTKQAEAYVDAYQQKEKWSCSAACLKAVLGYYDVDLTEEECIKRIGTKPHKGAETTQIVDAAEELGFEASEKSLSLEETRKLLDDGVPIICDIQSFTKKGSGHYVVLCDMDDEYCYLMDPNVEGNTRKLPIEEFVERWHDKAMAPPHEPMIRWGVIIKTTQNNQSDL